MTEFVGDDGINWDLEARRAADNDVICFEDIQSFDYFSKLLKPGMRVLDLGCNISKWNRPFRKLGLIYEGLDGSAIAIKIAKQRFPENTYHLKNAKEMHFHERFDVVFTHTVLQHMDLETKKKVIPKVRDALKEHGLFVIEEKCDIDSKTTFVRQKWIDFIEAYGFAWIGGTSPEDPRHGFVFRKNPRNRKSLKQLIITAGDKSHGKFLAQKWLPGLRNDAKYRGQVVILDYDLSDTFRAILEKDDLVSFAKETMELQNIWSDRHRAVINVLARARSLGYGTVLCIDGNDVIFQKPIAPLFKLAKDVVCYTTEDAVNEDFVRLEGSPGANEIWEVIKDKPIVNGGLYIGPIVEILKMEEYIYEHCKHFPVDQIWLNALVYYCKFPAKKVSALWNWYALLGFKVVDNMYYTRDGEKVAIFHDHPSILKTPKPSKIEVACVLLTLNEQTRIEPALNQVRKCVDFLLVLDGGSTDRTVEFARKIADKVETHKFSGSFAEEKNYARTLVPKSCRWILWIDADEMWDQGFLANLQVNLQTAEKDRVASFRFARINLPDSKNYPDYQVRLFLNSRDILWRGRLHERPYLENENIPLDSADDEERTKRLGVCTIDEYPIIHLPRRKDLSRIWWKT